MLFLLGLLGGSSNGLLSRSFWISYATNFNGFFVSLELEELADTELLDTVCGECVASLVAPPPNLLDDFLGLNAINLEIFGAEVIIAGDGWE